MERTTGRVFYYFVRSTTYIAGVLLEIYRSWIDIYVAYYLSGVTAWSQVRSGIRSASDGYTLE